GTLELLAAAAPGSLASLALGEAQLTLGAEAAARKSFAAVATGPWAYRAFVRLAELDLADFERGHDSKKLADADSAVHHALDQAPGYLPARAVVGRLLVHNGQPAGALAAFAPVVAARPAPAPDHLLPPASPAASASRPRPRSAARSSAARRRATCARAPRKSTRPSRRACRRSERANGQQ